MITIVEKESGVIITVDNATADERDLVKVAKSLQEYAKQEVKQEVKPKSVFSKFKCNQAKATANDYETIYEPKDEPKDEPF